MPLPPVAVIMAAETTEWRVNPGLEEREVDDGHFIADSNTSRIYHLNTVAAAVWQLPSSGETESEISATLAVAIRTWGQIRSAAMSET